MISDQKGNSGNMVSGSNSQLGKGSIGLVVLACVMGLTNPPRDEYIHYASGKVAAELQNGLCKESKLTHYLGDFGKDLLGVCKTGFNAPRSLINGAIDSATQRQNFLIFSLYNTEVMGHKYQTIGAFGNFLTFYSE